MTVNHGDAGDLVKRKLAAYWYCFAPTGCGIVDDILEAIAKAGAAHHSTEYWADSIEGDPPSYIEIIQETAKRTADCIEAQDAAIMVLEGESADRTMHVQTLSTKIKAMEDRLQSAERVVEAARWNLPLAKGYAAAHPVGSNAKYVAELEERLAAYDKETGSGNDLGASMKKAAPDNREAIAAAIKARDEAKP